MLSRLAQNLFWAGRYLERAESGARLINATTLLLLDLPRQTEFDWRALVEIVGEALFARHYPDATEARDALSPATATTRLGRQIRPRRENLRHTRDRIPREVWEEVNGLHLYMADEGQHIERRLARSRVMERVVRSGRTVAGLLESGMSRDAATTCSSWAWRSNAPT